MQLICEAYHMMKELLGMTPGEMHEVFDEWNKGELNSYLIEITRDIMAYKDEDGKPLVDKILDTAGQKGTGKWTAIAALDEGVPLTLIGEAVFSRCLSAMKEERVHASKVLKGPKPRFTGNKSEMIEDIRKALYASKLCPTRRVTRYARRRKNIRLEPELRRYSFSVAGRLHYQVKIPWENKRGF